MLQGRRLVGWMVAVTVVGAAEAAIPTSERDALVALYDSTAGPSWTRRQGWLGAAGTECSWSGVVCDQAGEHVIWLLLGGNKLKGVLPSTIGDLTRLQKIYLSHNRISGAIPESIGGLGQLRLLNLSENELTGPLPESLGQLINLEELRLADNRIDGSLPSAMGGMAKLQQLDLLSNSLTGPIPASFASLDALTFLSLSGNELSGAIPPELAGMASIVTLYLGANALSGPIPAELGTAITLRSLDLSGNHFSGTIPPSLGQLGNLQYLGLGRNSLNGTIPPELGSLSRLEVLRLDSNSLWGGIPAELGNLSALKDLALSYNRLSGTLPAELGRLGSLERLQLENNSISGRLPAWLGSLSKLTWLSLEGNYLWGPLPAELGRLGSLQYLDLGRNYLDGVLPDWLGDLSELTLLNVDGNRFSGPIPSSLGSLSKLTSLGLELNEFRGSIPSEIGNLRKLEYLRLDNNQLTGPIPETVANLVLLFELSVSGNQLTGPVPAWLSGMSELWVLDLANNRLTGTIPSGLGSLAGLEYLSLDQNQLTGTIPPELGSLAGLKYLALDQNHLTGTIPPVLGQLANLEELYLSQNQLTGAIPSELGGLAKLRALHVSGNQLVGELPSSLQNLTALGNGWGLDLRWNGLWTTSSSLRAFCTQKQGGDWSATQTVAPTGVQASAATDRTVKVSWTRIAFVDGAGGYRVLYSLAPGGPFTLAGTTQTKLATDLTVSGLVPGTTYHFVVETRTEPHDSNQNAVVSTRSSVANLLTTGQPERAILPGIARQNGQNNTTWRSEGVMTNPRATAANVLLEIVPRDGSAAAARKAYDLVPGQVVQVADIYTELGLSGGAGALRATGPVAGWVRTYNQGAEGTFGQDVVPVAAAAFDAGEAAVFPVYTPADVDTDFRSNFLVQNLEATPITLTLRIGTRTLDVTVPAGTYIQRNLVGQLVGAPPGLGILEVSGTGRWSGTVSSVDPVTGDPATVRALRPVGAGGTTVFAGVASQPGQNTTQWRSQAVLYNPSAALQAVVLEIVPRGASAPAASLGLALQPGEVRQIADLFAELGAGTGAGALRVNGAVLVWVRTFNQGVSGTFGQDVPPVRAVEWAAGETVLFPFERPAILTANFRSNLLLLNQGVGVLNVTLSGGGKTKTTTVDPGTYGQINNVGQFLGAPAGVAILAVTADGPWSGYVSTIDPQTGDPTTVRGLPKP